ncbi:Fe(3+) dicitrate transport ATP-binding protein FecE [Corynebacterium kutscheri]|uniref:ABC-type cobalamin/Fe3+-siderophore transport system, ATPase component n=1 Tax=Corynebacterium kutscheri TaxID=35755 RepID=A0A0F6R062_9CORY|nr:ABC transporter ATP-binding protein [Corynebacterium kutscheri]AKE41115.1 ABC-type cobalamin/Fe3+-siderophore transport system, ATPase component [Corynebacterium kutscheri]VEH07023.1 Fe(3+) dicitrate transport ATP-binding protein FecE [Corynebacterium kutscheri]VEH09433.1 Fe(3+) dicitrate transport ATP-binding protein FecE [Corynebacterium kutscheri]VEH79519.1 Fe(3+) dicitrate transport ATP-binding protein FecE [Corynebacterium kutscheri]
MSIPKTTTPDALNVSNVCWSAGKTLILNKVSFSAPAGKVTGIIGPNGCGKSTLIKTALALLSPDSGEIRVNGVNPHSLSSKRLAQLTALLAQHSQAQVDLKVEDIVALGKIPHQNGWASPAQISQDSLSESLAAAGIEQLRGRFWSTLSGGERQRVQLARVFTQNPKILFIDEPTNHLDPGAAWEIMQAITTRGFSVVGAFHDLNLAARFCDVIVVMKNGCVQAYGTPVETLTPDILQEIYGINVYVDQHPIDGGPLVIQTGVTPR